MSVNISKYTTELTDVECIQLRNHIGDNYKLAEDIENCNPVENFDVQRRKISTEPGVYDDCIVPIISISIGNKGKKESVETFEEMKLKSEEYDLDIYDAWYDNDTFEDNKVIFFMEPFELK